MSKLLDKPVVRSLYTSSLDGHAAVASSDCLAPDFAGAPLRPTTGTYWRTVRHMGGAQFYQLIRNRIFPKTKLRPWDGVKVSLPRRPPLALLPQWKPGDARQLLADDDTYADAPLAAVPQGASRFEIELHEMRAWRFYSFDFVNVDLTAPSDAVLLRKTCRQMVRWWEQHSTGAEMGGQPLALSLRILNWIKFAARNQVRAGELGDGALMEQILGSLRLQTLLLERCVEKHLMNNHLVVNAKALMFAGMFLECPERAHWWKQGESLLRDIFAKQILPDGGQVERAPTYHTWLLEHLVELRDTVCWFDPPGDIATLTQDYVRKMADFVEQIKHPDGQIPLLNDSAMDFAGTKEELDNLLDRAGVTAPAGLSGNDDVSLLSQSGYGIIRDIASGSHLILDCGPLGPDYQPGHGHCDVLSFELSLNGQRVVVDTGASAYEPGKERHYERSTAAHNTLRIDGEEQAEVWASYRAGRRPRVGPLQGGRIDGFPFLRGEHYAYSRRNVTHCRTIVRQPNDCWIILDHLYGSGSHTVESFIHLHPAIRVEQRESDCVLISSSERYSLTAFGMDGFKVKGSYYCPGYGLRQARSVIQYNWQGSLPKTFALVLKPVEGVSPSLRLRDAAAELDGVMVPLRPVEGAQTSTAMKGI